MEVFTSSGWRSVLGKSLPSRLAYMPCKKSSSAVAVVVCGSSNTQQGGDAWLLLE